MGKVSCSSCKQHIFSLSCQRKEDHSSNPHTYSWVISAPWRGLIVRPKAEDALIQLQQSTGCGT